MIRSCRIFSNFSYTKTTKQINYGNYIDDHEKGLWQGWGYFSYLSEIQSQSFTGVYFKINEESLEISLNETILPEIVIKILSLKFICGQKKICTLEQYQKYSLSPDTLQVITDNAILFMDKVSRDNKTCGVMQDFSNKEMIFCIYVKDQYFSFEKTIIKNYKKKIKGLSILSPLPDNAILPMLVSDGDVFFAEQVQFKIDYAFLFKRNNSLPIVIYVKIGTINGEACQVLTRDFNIPHQILKYPIDEKNNTIKGGQCCLMFRFFSKMVYMCSLSTNCEQNIERAATKFVKDVKSEGSQIILKMVQRSIIMEIL